MYQEAFAMTHDRSTIETPSSLNYGRPWISFEVVGVPVGLSLLLSGARKRHAEKVERLQRRNKLQQPWLQLREEKAGSVNTVDYCASQKLENVFKVSDQSVSEETQGVTDDWLRKQTTFLVEHLSDSSLLMIWSQVLPLSAHMNALSP